MLLFPGIILALIAGHLALVWYQKHTQFPGPGRTEQNVVGVRILPVFAMKGGAFFAMTFGVLALLGGLFQIDRPGSTLAYLSSRMAQTFSDSRLDEHYAPVLARRTPPAWTFIHGPRSSLSSSALRKQKSKK